MTHTPHRSRGVLTLAAVAGIAVASLLGGCNDAQAGSLFGAGIGALAGQAIGGNSEATLIGTAIGAAAGYVVGNEQDKARYGYGQSYDSGYDSSYQTYGPPSGSISVGYASYGHSYRGHRRGPSSHHGYRRRPCR